MRAEFLSRGTLQTLLDAESSEWMQARAEAVHMLSTPWAMQPTEAIRAGWRERPIGAVERVEVRALHEGEHLFLRLEWADTTANRDHGDNRVFPDGAAVAFPVREGAPLATMGAPGYPINAWFWRANEPQRGRHVIAEGLGSSRTLDRERIHCRGTWSSGRWRVVIARALRLESPHPVVQLQTGARCQFGLAVWEGSRQERAGLKSFSGEWLELDLDPVRS